MKLLGKVEHRFSLTVVLLLTGVIGGTCLMQPMLNSLSWDVFSYYLYLPATFIYHDLGLKDRSWVDLIIQKYHTTDFFYQAHPAENGAWVIKTSMGLAYFYAPFFFIGHGIATVWGYAPDGFSAPYQISLNVGMVVYACIGLVFLRKILLHYFNDMISGCVLALVVLGTNYFHLTAQAGLMPHNILLMLVAMFVWYAIKWSEHQQLKYAMVLGMISGLIIISRPNEIVCVLFLVILGWQNFRNGKITLKHVSFGVIVFFSIILPQLLYWKMTSGSFVYYSYRDPNEGFDFNEPYTMDFLFSFRKGWFVYTPLVVVMLVGMFTLFKKHKQLFYSVLAYVVVGVYVASSWSCWWYGGCCYSQRAVVSLYVVLALPLGFLLKWIWKQQWRCKISFALMLIGIVMLNLFQMWQFNHGIIDGDGMTKKYYCATFGQTVSNDAALNLLLPKMRINEDTVRKDFSKLPKTTYDYNTFVTSKNFKADHYIKNSELSNEPYYVMDADVEFSPSIDISYKKLNGDHSWAKASASIYFLQQEIKSSPYLVISTIHKGENFKYYTLQLPKDSIKFNAWIPMQKLYLTPEIRSKKDKLSVYLWNPNKCAFYIRGLKVDIYDF